MPVRNPYAKKPRSSTAVPPLAAATVSPHDVRTPDRKVTTIQNPYAKKKRSSAATPPPVAATASARDHDSNPNAKRTPVHSSYAVKRSSSSGVVNCAYVPGKRFTLVCVDVEYNTWLESPNRQASDAWIEGEGRVWQLGVVVMTFQVGDDVPDIVESYQSMVRPDGSWPSMHQTSRAFAVDCLKEKYGELKDPEAVWQRDGQPMCAVLERASKIFRKYFTNDCANTYFVAHNLACERKYLGKEYELHGDRGDLEFFRKIVEEYGFCTMVPASQVYFYRTQNLVDLKHRQTLETLYVGLEKAYNKHGCKMLGTGKHVRWHDAEADATACGEVAFKFIIHGRVLSIYDPPAQNRSKTMRVKVPMVSPKKTSTK